MNVFISWSGNRSKAVAELLRMWIKCVVQATKPWVSTMDLDRGSVWASQINEQLNGSSIGIICLTAENKNAPWILFEAGALSKGAPDNRVFTFLVDLMPEQVSPPLSSFNATLPAKEQLLQLVTGINNRVAEPLPSEVLQRTFETYWPQFEIGFRDALDNNPAGKQEEARSESSMLSEVLNSVRGLTSRLGTIETRQEALSQTLVGLTRTVISSPYVPSGFGGVMAGNPDSAGQSASNFFRVIRSPVTVSFDGQSPAAGTPFSAGTSDGPF